jgi:ferredoxin
MAKAIYDVRGGCVCCTTCRNLCPTGAVDIGPDGARIDPDLCVGCGKCAENCPVEAIMPVERPSLPDTEDEG